MNFRSTQPGDLEGTYVVRGSTRQNPISKHQLELAGFTHEAISEKYATGEYVGWVCEHESRIIGFATGNTLTGEIVAVAVLPEYEGRKIGMTLLSRLVDSLVAKGCRRLWLEASPDPEIRAHGFYRANGWVPTGRKAANGDEILERPRVRSGPLAGPVPDQPE